MAKGLKRLIVFAMVVTWLVTGGMLYQSPGMRGKFAIAGTGILLNCLLAAGYSFLGRSPVRFRD